MIIGHNWSLDRFQSQHDDDQMANTNTINYNVRHTHCMLFIYTHVICILSNIHVQNQLLPIWRTVTVGGTLLGVYIN